MYLWLHGLPHYCQVMITYSSNLPPTTSSLHQAPSFYWELELCHLGDSSSDASHIAMGYAPSPQKPAEGQPWAYAQSTCLIRRYLTTRIVLIMPTYFHFRRSLLCFLLLP